MKSIPKCPSRKTGLAAPETWLILLVLVGSGAAAGYAAGQYSVIDQADSQVRQIERAYLEATQSKNALIDQCLRAAESAAQAARGAAQSAKEAVEADE